MNQISWDFYDEKENPSSVHMVTMSVVLSAPTPRVLIPVVHKKARVLESWPPSFVFQDLRLDPDFRQVELGSSQAGREAGSWQFSSRTEQGAHADIQAFPEHFCCQIGGRFRASEVHQANLFFIQRGF